MYHHIIIIISVRLETVPASHLSGECWEITKDVYPAPAFAFQVLSASDVSRVASKVHALTSFLTSRNVGHNVFVTRGTSFDGQRQGQDYDAVRVIVWARTKLVGVKDPGAFVVAVCELSGQILCYDKDKYE